MMMWQQGELCMQTHCAFSSEIKSLLMYIFFAVGSISRLINYRPFCMHADSLLYPIRMHFMDLSLSH